MKDGQEVIIGKDVSLQMDDRKIDLSVVNPSREKSGVYTVILRNAQGEVRKDINVNVLGNVVYCNVISYSYFYAKKLHR